MTTRTTKSAAATPATALAPVETEVKETTPISPAAEETVLVSVNGQIFKLDQLLAAYTEELEKVVDKAATRIDQVVNTETLAETLRQKRTFVNSVRELVSGDLSEEKELVQRVTADLLEREEVLRAVREEVRSVVSAKAKGFTRRLKLVETQLKEIQNQLQQGGVAAPAQLATAATPKVIEELKREPFAKVRERLKRHEAGNLLDAAKDCIDEEHLRMITGQDEFSYNLLSDKEKEVARRIEQHTGIDKSTKNVALGGPFVVRAGGWDYRNTTYDSREIGRKLVVNISSGYLAPLYECVLNVLRIEDVTLLKEDPRLAASTMFERGVNYHPLYRVGLVKSLRIENVFPPNEEDPKNCTTVYHKLFNPLNITREEVKEHLGTTSIYDALEGKISRGGSQPLYGIRLALYLQMM